MTFKTKLELISALRSQLSNKPSQALKALVTLFNRQTEDEKQNEHTRHFNNVGFNHNDAKILSSIAKQYIRLGTLSERQMQVLMRLVPKYAKQLIEKAISEGIYRKEGGYWVH